MEVLFECLGYLCDSNFFLRKVDLLTVQFLNNFFFFGYVSKIEDVLFSKTWMTTKLTLIQEANRIIMVRNLGQEKSSCWKCILTKRTTFRLKILVNCTHKFLTFRCPTFYLGAEKSLSSKLYCRLLDKFTIGLSTLG